MWMARGVGQGCQGPAADTPLEDLISQVPVLDTWGTTWGFQGAEKEAQLKAIEDCSIQCWA